MPEYLAPALRPSFASSLLLFSPGRRLKQATSEATCAQRSRNPPVGRRLLVAWPESHAMHSVSVLRCYARLTQVDLQNSSQAPGVSFGSFRIFLSFSRCIALFLGSTPGGTESCGAVFAPAFADNSRSELSIQKTSFVYL